MSAQPKDLQALNEPLPSQPVVSWHTATSRLRPGEVSAMFDRIAHRYDLLNRLLSAGTDRKWRRTAVDCLVSHRPKAILDIATGTGDMVVECLRLRPERIVGVDPSPAMLAHARTKLLGLAGGAAVEFLQGSVEALPFPSGSFDGVTCAFGVRNFAKLEEGIAQMFRVLRPGGTVVILEFSRPHGVPGGGLYQLYFSRVLPFVGGLVSGERGAYRYLRDTIRSFPSGQDFLELLRDYGFTDLHALPLTYGIATVYTATRPDTLWS